MDYGVNFKIYWDDDWRGRNDDNLIKNEEYKGWVRNKISRGGKNWKNKDGRNGDRRNIWRMGMRKFRKSEESVMENSDVLDWKGGDGNEK